MRALRRKSRRPMVEIEIDAAKSPPKRQRTVKLLMDLRPEAQRHSGPGPSKIAYRMTRLWKKGWVRRTALVVLPLLMLAIIAVRFATDPGVHAAMSERKASFVSMLAARPEFALRGYHVSGASPDLHLEIDQVIDLPPNLSSLTLDVAGVQGRIAALPSVKSAKVSLNHSGTLEIAVEERLPAALWRDRQDALWLVDREGVVIGPAVTRAGYAELPILLGEAAPDAVTEALRLYTGMADLKGRVRALVRVGERRWNVALDRGLTIMLPANRPAPALDRVLAWHYGEELLDRGLTAVDMRLSDRPVLRMTPEAAQRYQFQNAVTDGSGEET